MPELTDIGVKLLNVAMNSGAPDGEKLAALNRLQAMHEKGRLLTPTYGERIEAIGRPTTKPAKQTADEIDFVFEDAASVRKLKDDLAAAQANIEEAKTAIRKVRAERDALKAELSASQPTGRKSKASPDLTSDVKALFEAEPKQPGADKIALKLHRRKPDVRRTVSALVANGWLVVKGRTRDRSYSRPA